MGPRLGKGVKFYHSPPPGCATVPSIISKLVFFIPHVFSSSIVAHEIYLSFPFSNSTFTFVSVLSSNLPRQHRVSPSPAHPSHRCLDCQCQCPGWCFAYLSLRCLTGCHSFQCCIDLLWRYLAAYCGPRSSLLVAMRHQGHMKAVPRPL